jgi:hypothetical protein
MYAASLATAIPSGFSAQSESPYPREFDPKAWREQRERPRREGLPAKRLVNFRNKRAKAGRKPSFFPTIGIAIAAKTPVLDVPGQTIGAVDLRTISGHPCPDPRAADFMMSRRPGPPQPSGGVFVSAWNRVRYCDL